MSDSHMNERRAGNLSPDPGPSTSAPPQSTNRPYRRALLLAIIACFLWPPLTILIRKGLAVSNGTISMLSLVPVGTAFWLLYDSRFFLGKSRAFRVCIVLLTSVALFGCAWILWVALILLLIKCTGSGIPLPI